MRNGRARLVCDAGEVQVKEGDVVFTYCGCRYQSYWQGLESEERNRRTGERPERPAICFDSLCLPLLSGPREPYFPLQKIPTGPITGEVTRLID